MNTVIHVFLACTRDYFQYALYIIFSIRKYSRKHVHVHLMVEDDVSFYEAELAQLHFDNLEFTFYSADKLDSVLSEGHRLNLSKMTYSRLLLCDLLGERGIEKCLYLDCDTLIVNYGLDEFYDMPLEGKYAAAVDEVSMMCFNRTEMNDCGVSRYFNAGVVLFNIKEILRDGVNNEFIKLLKEPSDFMLTRGYSDQSILNMTFREKVVFVDPKYNVQSIIVGYPQYEKYLKLCGYAGGQRELFGKCVVQHMMGAKPWENRWYTWQAYQLLYKQWMKNNYEMTCRQFNAYCESVGASKSRNIKIAVSYSFSTTVLDEFKDADVYVKIGGGGFSEGVDFTDDTGDNISQYNAYLNDFTNLYWIRSNYEKIGNPEYIGHDHYRRVLRYNRYALRPDIIQCKVEEGDLTIYEYYVKYHVKGDIDLFMSEFSKEFPQLSGPLGEFMSQKTNYPCEIFVMHRDLFFEYMDFLKKCIGICLRIFSVEDLEKRDKYQKRAPGFIMERMTSFWIYMKKTAGGVKVIDTMIDVYKLPSPYQRPGQV